MDAEIRETLATLCEAPSLVFEANARLRFALYDVIEKLYQQKIKNISQCIEFLRRESSSTSRVPEMEKMKIETPVEAVEQNVSQLDETYCESLSRSMKQVFEHNGDRLNSYIDEHIDAVRLILQKEKNQQKLIESFMARAFYDAYNNEKVEQLRTIVRVLRLKHVYDSEYVQPAIAKMRTVELGDFFESSKLQEVKSILETL
jgi:uncharacterized hydantoinase/oxoprolinase family protein